MARASFFDHALDNEGRPINGATVYVYEVGTTNLISETLYSALTGAGTKTNPFTTSSDGKIEFFLDNPKLVTIRITKSGLSDQSYSTQVDTLGVNHRGAWSAVTTYNAQDAVSSGGSSWVALRANTNVTPAEGADWSLLAEAGTDGAPGQDGTISLLRDEGVDMAQRGKINFIGSGVTLSDDSVNDETEVTITGGTATFVGARGRHITSGQTIATGTITAVEFNGESFDTDGFHDNTTNPSRITIPAGKGGYYRITGGVGWVSNATGYRQAFIQLNGVGSAQANDSRPAVSGTSTSQTVTTTLLLVAGDFVELIARQTSGGNLDLIAEEGTFLEVAFLGT